jgi:hypothetical protein
MPSAQALNSTISIYRRARAVRDNRRQTSVKSLTTPWDHFLVAIPGEETEVLETRNTGFPSDAFRFGHPVTVYPRTRTTLATVVAAVPNIKLVKMTGNWREWQIENTTGNQTADLYTQLRAVSPGGYRS